MTTNKKRPAKRKHTYLKTTKKAVKALEEGIDIKNRANAANVEDVQKLTGDLNLAKFELAMATDNVRCLSESNSQLNTKLATLQAEKDKATNMFAASVQSQIAEERLQDKVTQLEKQLGMALDWRTAREQDEAYEESELEKVKLVAVEFLGQRDAALRKVRDLEKSALVDYYIHWAFLLCWIGTIAALGVSIYG